MNTCTSPTENTTPRSWLILAKQMLLGRYGIDAESLIWVAAVTDTHRHALSNTATAKSTLPLRHSASALEHAK